jgi:hypothetical protein
MARIQEEILDAFYAKLSASENTGPQWSKNFVSFLPPVKN